MSRTITLGGRIRDRRVELGIGLRELARRMGITPSYLSDIETDRRIPSEGVLRALAKELKVSFDELTALAGRLDQETEEYLRRQPAAGVLFRRLREKRFGQSDLEQLIKGLDQHRKARGST